MENNQRLGSKLNNFLNEWGIAYVRAVFFPIVYLLEQEAVEMPEGFPDWSDDEDDKKNSSTDTV